MLLLYNSLLFLTSKVRIVLGIVLAVAMVLTWMELDVGVFGSPFAGS